MGSQITKQNNNEEVKSKGWSFQKSSELDLSSKYNEFEDLFIKPTLPTKQDSLPESFFKLDSQYTSKNYKPHNTFKGMVHLDKLEKSNTNKSKLLPLLQSPHSNVIQNLILNNLNILTADDLSELNNVTNDDTQPLGQLILTTHFRDEKSQIFFNKGDVVDYIYITRDQNWFLAALKTSPTTSIKKFIWVPGSLVNISPSLSSCGRLGTSDQMFVNTNSASSSSSIQHSPVAHLRDKNQSLNLFLPTSSSVNGQQSSALNNGAAFTSLKPHPIWYHGALPRKRAEILLEATPGSTNGSYIVRESESLPGQYSITLRFDNRVYHYRINNSKQSALPNNNTDLQPSTPFSPSNGTDVNKYYIVSKYAFDTLEQLIAHHSIQANGLVCQLLYPIPPTVVPSTNAKSNQTNNTSSPFHLPPPPPPPIAPPLTPICSNNQLPYPPNSNGGPMNLQSERILKILRELSSWELARRNIILKHKIGSGQYGDVYHALSSNLNGATYHPVAVKTLKEETMAVNDFLREACVMKDLRHPNLVQLLGVCIRETPYYIVTEYMDGGNLLDYLNSLNLTAHGIDSHYLLSQFIDISIQIAFGMAYLESLNYIHRDLAARNILISKKHANQLIHDQIPNGSGEPKFPTSSPGGSTHSSNNNPLDDYINLELGENNHNTFQSAETSDHVNYRRQHVNHGRNDWRFVCKVADFGLARKLNPGTEYYNARVGAKFPIKWTAPEGLTYNKFSTKSDIWSYGVLLWEVFTFGSQPYPSIELNQVLPYLERDYRMTKPQDCPLPIYSLMLECWKWEPFQRPTFIAIKSELESIMINSSHHGQRNQNIQPNSQLLRCTSLSKPRMNRENSVPAIPLNSKGGLLSPLTSNKPGIIPASFRSRKFSLGGGVLKNSLLSPGSHNRSTQRLASFDVFNGSTSENVDSGKHAAPCLALVDQTNSSNNQSTTWTESIDTNNRKAKQLSDETDPLHIFDQILAEE